MYVCICMCVHVCTYACMCVYICMYSHTRAPGRVSITSTMFCQDKGLAASGNATHRDGSITTRCCPMRCNDSQNLRFMLETRS